MGDVGWYGSAYLVTTCAFQLIYGRIYTFYSPKWVFIIAIGIFEVGSAVCGAAPSSIAFIVGRTISGLGAAGIFSGAIVIITYILPLHKRPMFQGLFGAIFGIASVIGPLLGGVFTDKVSWRWCFYVNLPVGAVTVIIIILILRLPSPKNANTPLRQQFLQLDPLGTMCFLPGVVCLLLALQWGGSTYAWKSARVIALLILFGVLIILFVAIQIWKQESATVPPRIFKNRSIMSGFLYAICVGGALMVMVYYFPIWFQAIKGVSAVKSGIDNLPLVLALVIGSISAGIAVTKVGYYTPFMIIGSVFMAIGAGFVSTLKPDSGHAEWMGYQVIFGLGMGLGMQQASVAAQTVLSRQDVAIGVSLILFAQSLGGAIMISAGQNVFANKLISGMSQISGLDPAIVATTGATNLRQVVATKDLPRVIAVYNKAVTQVFYVAIAVSCMSVLGALAMEWKSVKRAPLEMADAARQMEKTEIP